MSIAVEEERPVALLVEDKARALIRRKKMFEEHGFITIGASTKEEAMREFLSTPAIDIVVTDIDLDVTVPADRSGVELARTFKREREDLPVVGYSAAFGEDELGQGDWAHFDDHIPKGGKSTIAEMEQRLTSWRRLAIAHRRARLALAIDELERIKVKYRVLDADLQTLRDFLPGSHLPSAVAQHSASGNLTADEVMARSGYHLRLIESGTERPTATGGRATSQATIAVWVRDEGGEVLAELYGHPSLYESGKTESQAVENLLVLMDGFYGDFCNDAKPALSVELQQLKNYLIRVFG